MFTDFSQVHNSEEVEELNSLLNECVASDTLHDLADEVESKDRLGVYEDLVEMARETADHNPNSETAHDVRLDLVKALNSIY